MKYLVLLATLTASFAMANGSSSVFCIPSGRALRSENNSQQVFQLPEAEFTKISQLISVGAKTIDFGERGTFVPDVSQKFQLWGRIIGKIGQTTTELWLVDDNQEQ